MISAFPDETEQMSWCIPQICWSGQKLIVCILAGVKSERLGFWHKIYLPTHVHKIITGVQVQLNFLCIPSIPQTLSLKYHYNQLVNKTAVAWRIPLVGFLSIFYPKHWDSKKKQYSVSALRIDDGISHVVNTWVKTCQQKYTVIFAIMDTDLHSEHRLTDIPILSMQTCFKSHKSAAPVHSQNFPFPLCLLSLNLSSACLPCRGCPPLTHSQSWVVMVTLTKGKRILKVGMIFCSVYQE